MSDLIRCFNKEYYDNASDEEKKFLDNYCPDPYKKPSCTVDICILTVDPKGNLCILLIPRKEFPYKNKWSLPGGFLNVDKESVGDCALRQLEEKTGMKDVFLNQLYTYSSPERDPRMHIISVAHYALCPYETVIKNIEPADLFRFNFGPDGYFFLSNNKTSVQLKDLAFDHGQMIEDVVKRIRGRIDYAPDLFSFLSDKNEFTIFEFKQIYDAVLGRKTDNANFRTMFLNRYVKTGMVEDLKRKSNTSRHAALFKLVTKIF